MVDYTIILTRKYAGNEWVLNGDDYTGLIWLSDTSKPTKEELDALWELVQQEIIVEKTAKATERQEILDRLGITTDEAKLLIEVI